MDEINVIFAYWSITELVFMLLDAVNYHFICLFWFMSVKAVLLLKEELLVPPDSLSD